MSEKQRRAILFGRYSSDKQGDGDSRERQERNNRRIAKERNILIVGAYFDEGVSVKDGATPLFKKIISELPNDVGIICENLDRINRGHPWRAKAYIADIIEAGHFIITYQDGREYTTATIDQIETLVMGDMTANLAYSENEKRKLRVNESKNRNIELARKGIPAPLGAWLPAHIHYDFQTKDYVIDEPERKIIERIFEEYISGKGCSNIARGLNQDKVITFRRKLVGGWIGGVISQILRCEGMNGTLVINGERIPKAFPPAVNEQLFYKVQSMFAHNKQRHGNYSALGINNILRGVLRCHKCNNPMRIYIAYKGSMRIQCVGYRFGKCDQKTMLEFPEIEFEFAKWFVPIAKDKLLGKDSTAERIETLAAKRQELQKRIEVTLALLDSGFAVNEISARLARLEAERTSIDNELSTAKATQTNTATHPETFKTLERLIHKIGSGDNELRHKVASLIPSIVKVIRADISEKYFPVFTCELINGDIITWSNAPAEVLHYKDGKTVTNMGQYKRKDTTKKKKP